MHGGETTLVSVRERTGAAETRIVLDVADSRAAYRVLDGAGHVLERAPARGERHWAVTLTPYGDSWRVWNATETPS